MRAGGLDSAKLGSLIKQCSFLASILSLILISFEFGYAPDFSDPLLGYAPDFSDPLVGIRLGA
jgi:hypothetical protein